MSMMQNLQKKLKQNLMRAHIKPPESVQSSSNRAWMRWQKMRFCHLGIPIRFPWCFFVTKKQNKDKTAVSGRLVFDYRRLNEKIKGMNFPLTPIKNFFDQASQYSCFAAIDIRNAFLTVSMTERAKKRCSIVTHFGVFIPQRMPFGLKTSPAGFCYVMHLILSGLAFARYYMDDICNSGRKG